MMKKKIYDYLKNNANSSIHKIAYELKIYEQDVLKTVSDLESKYYICMKILPLGNDIEPDNSCFYSVINKNIEYAG